MKSVDSESLDILTQLDSILKQPILWYCFSVLVHVLHAMRVFGQYLSSAETAVLLVLLGLLLYRLFGRRKADGRGEATPALMDSSLPGEIAKLPTQWGDIYVRVFDPVKSGHRAEREEEKTPIVCLPGINSKLVCGFGDSPNSVL